MRERQSGWLRSSCLNGLGGFVALGALHVEIVGAVRASAVLHFVCRLRPPDTWSTILILWPLNCEHPMTLLVAVSNADCEQWGTDHVRQHEDSIASRLASDPLYQRHLQDNALATLPEGIFEGLTSLSQLYVSGRVCSLDVFCMGWACVFEIKDQHSHFAQYSVET